MHPNYCDCNCFNSENPQALQNMDLKNKTPSTPFIKDRYVCAASFCMEKPEGKIQFSTHVLYIKKKMSDLQSCGAETSSDMSLKSAWFQTSLFMHLDRNGPSLTVCESVLCQGPSLFFPKNQRKVSKSRP